MNKYFWSDYDELVETRKENQSLRMEIANLHSKIDVLEKQIKRRKNDKE